MDDFETVRHTLSLALTTGRGSSWGDMDEGVPVARLALDRIEAENERLRVERDNFARLNVLNEIDARELAAEVKRLRAAMAFLDQCTCVCAYVRRARQALEGDSE